MLMYHQCYLCFMFTVGKHRFDLYSFFIMFQRNDAKFLHQRLSKHWGNYWFSQYRSCVLNSIPFANTETRGRHFSTWQCLKWSSASLSVSIAKDREIPHNFNRAKTRSLPFSQLLSYFFGDNSLPLAHEGATKHLEASQSPWVVVLTSVP